MPELKDVLKTGGLGGATGIIGLVIGLSMGGDKVEIVTDATIIDQLAVSAEYVKPEIKQVFITADTAGAYGHTPVLLKDTVTIPAAPALKGFPNGVSDYEMCKVMAPGKKYQLLFSEDGVIIDAAEYQPTDNEWTLSVRPRVSLHTGK